MLEAPTTLAPAITSSPVRVHAPASSTIELSVVMPCLNEAETIGTCIRKARSALRENDVYGEIIVADNGSTDGSIQIARSLGARVVHVDQKGYGSALRGGIEAARGRYIIMGDADDSYNFLKLADFLEPLRRGHDLVMGNRFRGGIAPRAMPWKHRWIGNPILTGVGRLFFHCPSGDFHCGLRGFSKSAYDRMGLRTSGMEFASEMVIKSTLLGLDIAEIPTTLQKDGRSRPPHLRSWRDGWRHLRFMLLYCPRWLFLIPGLMLMLAGLIGYGLAIPNVSILGAKLDVNTLLFSSLAMLIGYESIQFGLFAKVFATTEGLLPPDPRLSAMFRKITLESGLVFGSGLLVAGLTFLIWAVLQWMSAGFGDLDYAASQRVVIPGVTLCALGFQTILSSFFLSILGLSRI